MASRFEDVTDSDVAALKDAAEGLNTRKNTINWLTVFENWCGENSRSTIALRSFLLNSWIKFLSGFITGHRQEQSVEACDSGNEEEQRQLSNIIDGKEIQFNQTTSRVPLQPLIQSTAAVSSGHVYNFHNCNVVINQGQAHASSSIPSVSNTEP